MVKRKLIIELAGLCNNNCVFCTKSGYSEARILDYQNVIREYFERGFNDIDFNGSEPTLHPNIIELIRSANSTGYKKITLFTNGRLFSYDRVLKEYKEAGLTKLIFNIYSSNKDVHDRISRVKGSSEQSLRGLKNALLMKGLSVGVNLTLSQLNYKDIEKTIESLIERGVEFININPVIPSQFKLNENIICEKDFILSNEQISKLKNIDYDNVTFNLFPFCELGEYPDKIREKEVAVFGADTKIHSIEQILKNKFHYEDKCSCCEFKNDCWAYANNCDKGNYFSLWCASDLHACETNHKKTEAIIFDASKISFNQGIVAGDFVEGELDHSSYDIYADILDKSGFKNKLDHVAGNHEYLYFGSPENYNLDKYRELISDELNYSKDFGNLHIIYLSLDKNAKEAKAETIEWLKLEIEKNKNKIVVVVSHYPSSEYRYMELEEVDLWISGHSRFVNEQDKRCDILEDEGVYNVYAGGTDRMKTKLLIFKDGTKEIIIRTRDHKNKNFCEDIHININKKYMNGDENIQIKNKKERDKIKFSIPFNSDLNLIRWAIDSGQVAEVYFAGPSGDDYSDPYDELKNFGDNELKQLIEICNKKNVHTNFLLNKYTMFFENRESIIKYLNKLKSYGQIDYVTISDPYLAGFLKSKFSEIKLQSSIFLGIDTAEKVKEGIKMGLSSFCLDPSVNRNYGELKRISSLKNKHDISIKLLGMHGCYSDCFFAWKHSELPILKRAAEKSNYNNKETFGGGIDITRCHYATAGIADEIKRKFIRPEDIDFYEKHGLANIMKVAYRDNSSALLKEKMKAYFSRKYEGDLFEILGSNKHNSLSCDNTKFPKDFIEKVMNCNNECDDCDYCEDLAKKCISTKQKNERR